MKFALLRNSLTWTVAPVEITGKRERGGRKLAVCVPIGGAGALEIETTKIFDSLTAATKRLGELQQKE